MNCMPSSDIEAQREAIAFMEENEPFIEDGGPSTLQRIVIDGSTILIKLGKELQESTEALTKNQWALVDATEKKAPTKKLHALEVEERRLKRVISVKKAAHDHFDTFWNRANGAYRERLVEDECKVVVNPYGVTIDDRGILRETYEGKPTPAAAESKPPKRRNIFSRIFG